MTARRPDLQLTLELHQERPERYPEAPGFKLRGFPEPSTSQDVAIAMQDRAATLRATILEVMRDDPGADWTPDEMAERLHVNLLSIRPRFTELSDPTIALIVRTGARRPSSTGHAQGVYRLQEAT